MFAKYVWIRNAVIFLFVMNLFVLFAGNASADSPYYSKCEGGYSPLGAVSQPPDYNLCYQRYFEIKEYAENSPATGISADKPTNSSGFIFNGSPCLASEYVISFNTDVSSTNGDDFELVSTHPAWDSLIYLNLSENPLTFGPFKIDWGKLPSGWLSTKGIYKLTYGYQQRSTLYSSSYSNLGRYYACVPSKFQVLLKDDLKSISQILKSNFDEDQYCENNVEYIVDTAEALVDIVEILEAAKKVNFDPNVIKEMILTGNYSEEAKEFIGEVISASLLDEAHDYFVEWAVGEANIGDSYGESLGWLLCSTDSLWVAPVEDEFMEQIDEHLYLVPKTQLYPVNQDAGETTEVKRYSDKQIIDVKWMAPKLGSADHLILYKASQHKTNGQPTLVDAYPLKPVTSGMITENIQCHGISGATGEVTFDYWITTAIGNSGDIYNQNGKFASTHSKWAYLGPVTLPACTTATQVSVANYPNCGANSGQFDCGSNTTSDSGSSTNGGGGYVPTCSISKSTKPIVFVQKIGGGEKCVLISDSVSDLSVLGLSAVDEVYINDPDKISEVQLFPQIGFSGGLPHVVTSSATGLAQNPSGYGNKFKSARLESREYKCDGKPGIYTKFNDGSCMYVTASVKLSNTPYKGLNVAKVWAVGEYWGKWHEKEDKSGANLEFSSSTKETDGKRYYAYLEVKSFNKCDRGQLESMGYAYGNSEPDWNGQCIVLGKPGDRVSLAEGTIRVLRSPGNPVYCWKDQNYRNNDGSSHAEYGNTPGKNYVIQDNRRSCLVVRKNNAPNPVIPHKEHGQQYAVGTPIDLCFNSGGDPDNDALTFLVQIYRPYNPSVDFNSLIIEREMLNEAGCYRVKTSLPAGGYGYNIHAYDNLPFEAKQSMGMWGAFRVTDPTVPVVTDTTPNGTVVAKMPLICSDWVWQNYGTARFNLWRYDPNGWVMLGFNLWQPDRCWSPDQFGFTEPGTYQWGAVGLKGTSNMPSGQLHIFVVTGDDPIKPANGSTHNGYVPQVCWPTMGTTVSAVLPTTKAAYSVQVTKDNYAYGNYAWVSGSCYQIPNLGNGTYTVQVDLNTWANTYQAGAWKRTFSVTGMSDPITPANGVTLAAMPTLCQPQQGAWVVKYFFYLYTNNVYAGATPQMTSTCWSPSYSFMNGNYKVIPAIVAWNGKVITMPSFTRYFTLNSAARSGGEQEVLDQTSPVGDISEAELLAIQGVIPLTSLYLPLIATDTSASVENSQTGDQNQQNVEVEEKQPDNTEPLEQSEMKAQVFLPIVTR
jgi:hypothetical protein